MPKTRRAKRNTSPTRPYRNSKAYVVVQGETITTAGIRGRTRVVRVTDETGKRVATVRKAEEVVQKPATGRGKPVQVGRQYTGVARSKTYPYRSVKRGAAPVEIAGQAPEGVIVSEAAE